MATYRAKMADKYIGTTAVDLDHYFRNEVGAVRMSHIAGDRTCNFEDSRRDFIAGLERTLMDHVPESEGVTRTHLQEMVQMAQGDWSNIETIKRLYKRYFEVRGKEYNEEALFGK